MTEKRLRKAVSLSAAEHLPTLDLASKPKVRSQIHWIEDFTPNLRGGEGRQLIDLLTTFTQAWHHSTRNIFCEVFPSQLSGVR